jgi:hypothetical protein
MAGTVARVPAAAAAGEVFKYIATSMHWCYVDATAVVYDVLLKY